MMRQFTLFNFLAIISISCIGIDDENIMGNDYRLFHESPIWNLAKAVRDENISEIRRIVTEDRVNIDYQEEKYGHTILMLSVINQNYNSCKCLLELGANPNLHEKFSGATALIYAARIESNQDSTAKFIKLLLAHRANPNDSETGPRQIGNSIRFSPLLMACSDVNQFTSPINKVKILVEAHSDINYKDEYNNFALREAMIHKHYDVVLYLLENGANYNEMLFDREKFTKNGKKIYIADLLREDVLPLNSKKYQEKMNLVKYLKLKGIDYRSIPIPDVIINQVRKKYPDTWEEYLKVY